jgi:hypothetical protein
LTEFERIGQLNEGIDWRRDVNMLVSIFRVEIENHRQHGFAD